MHFENTPSEEEEEEEEEEEVEELMTNKRVLLCWVTSPRNLLQLHIFLLLISRFVT
jgi:hypothetical protein